MSSIKELYNNLEKFDTIEDTINYIKCFVAKGAKSKYVEFEKFDKFLLDVINMKKNLHDNKTEDFPVMSTEMYNLLYIDIDYATTSKNFVEINKTIADLLREILMELFRSSTIFMFIPETYTICDTRRKCGIHCFIFCKEILTANRRREIKDKLILNIEESRLNEYIMEIQNEIYQKENDISPITSISQIIDDQVLLNCKHSTIIPFAKKDANARNYVLMFSNFKKETTKSLLIKPTAEDLEMCKLNKRNNNIDYTDLKSFDELRKMDPSCVKDYVKEHLKIIHKEYSEPEEGEEKIHIPSELLNAEMFLYDCMSGLSCMCSNHYVIKIFSKGAWSDNNRFIYKLIKFYYALYVMTVSEIETQLVDYITEILYLILAPLFIRGGKTDSEKVKTDLRACVEYFDKGDTSFFKKISSEQVAGYKRTKLNKKDDRPTDEDFRSHKIVKDFLRNQIAEFVVFIKENIYQAKYIIDDKEEGYRVLKREIEPFKPKDFARDIEEYPFSDLRSEPSNKKFYDEQIQNIIKLMILCETWESGFDSTDGIIVKILSAITSHYIFATKDSNSEKKVPYTIYIYNIKQSHSLESLPYNQWIIDNSDYLTEWLTNLYTDFIEPIQNESVFYGFGGLGHILKLIHDDHQLRTQPGMSFTKDRDSSKNVSRKRDDPRAFINKIENNIIQFYNHFLGREIPKVYEPSDRNCPYFSVRNGIIEYFIKDGKWKKRLRPDNRDIILNAYSLATYYENYDCENEVPYKQLNKILHDIYPDDEDFEYMMNLFSTAFCPQIYKDQLLFAFGTGSDGKSTMSRLLGTILGNTSGELHVLEDGNQITLKNPSGYCSSFKPQCLQESQNSSNANEGGIISFDRKTFVVAQEPPKGKIHSEIIKDFTSGGISNGRSLYKGNKQFVINTLCIIETNMIPQFDVIDDAVKRRVIVYKHNTKFISSATNQYKNRKRENVKVANSEIINRILQDTSYWTALLMMMTNRVVNLRNTKYKDSTQPDDIIYVSQLSHIPKPYNVEVFTSNVFGKTTGVNKYLQENLIDKCEYGAIFLNDLIERIIEEDKIQKSKRGAGILETVKPSQNEKKNEIKQVIQNRFGDDLFKIREEHIRKDNAKGVFRIDERKVENIRKQIMKLRQNDIVEKFTNGFSMETIEDGNDESYRDVIIVGVNFVEKQDDDADD